MRMSWFEKSDKRRLPFDAAVMRAGFLKDAKVLEPSSQEALPPLPANVDTVPFVRIRRTT